MQPHTGRIRKAESWHLLCATMSEPYYLNGEITVEEAVDNALKASQQILDDWRRLNA